MSGEGGRKLLTYLFSSRRRVSFRRRCVWCSRCVGMRVNTTLSRNGVRDVTVGTTDDPRPNAVAEGLFGRVAALKSYDPSSSVWINRPKRKCCFLCVCVYNNCMCGVCVNSNVWPVSIGIVKKIKLSSILSNTSIVFTIYVCGGVCVYTYVLYVLYVYIYLLC